MVPCPNLIGFLRFWAQLSHLYRWALKFYPFRCHGYLVVSYWLLEFFVY